jgi:hypothetical protein
MTGPQISVKRPKGRLFEVAPFGLVSLTDPGVAGRAKDATGCLDSSARLAPGRSPKDRPYRAVCSNTGRARASAGKLIIATAHVMLVVRRCWSLFSRSPASFQRDPKKER